MVLTAFAGCGEPTLREYENRRELEALLTAVSLKSVKALEQDARRIEARHESGVLSDQPYQVLRDIIEKARGGHWTEAEQLAYKFREESPFFD